MDLVGSLLARLMAVRVQVRVRLWMCIQHWAFLRGGSSDRSLPGAGHNRSAAIPIISGLLYGQASLGKVGTGLLLRCLDDSHINYVTFS